MKIYVASSWKNTIQQEVVNELRKANHEVYDFRSPDEEDIGFNWAEIDEGWKNWHPEDFHIRMEHKKVVEAFEKDFEAMNWADICILVTPSGKSSHLEAGYFVGVGKPLIILLGSGHPETMYHMATVNCLTIEEIKEALEWISIDIKNKT